MTGWSMMSGVMKLVRPRIRAIGESVMPLEEITLALFAACNTVRVVDYIPQILKAATDKNGASSISFTTKKAGPAADDRLRADDLQASPPLVRT